MSDIKTFAKTTGKPLMEINNPYVGSLPVKVPPETLQAQRENAKGKAKASYPDRPLGTGTKNTSGGRGGRALTPGTSPAGS